VSRTEAGICVVVDDDRIVLGVVREEDLQAAGARDVADVVVEGPTSVRADSDLAGLVERMEDSGTDHVLVTTGQGGLVGLFVREDVS
jgi:CBS-domain-containing membrane protein